MVGSSATPPVEKGNRTVVSRHVMVANDRKRLDVEIPRIEAFGALAPRPFDLGFEDAAARRDRSPTR